MGCVTSRRIMDLTSIRIDIPLKRNLPMYFETSSQRTSNINQSIEPIQIDEPIHVLKKRKYTHNKETIMLIKYEIENPRINDNFISYGSPTLNDICLKNPRLQKRTCESIMLRVDKLRS
jgi:transposase